jgi:anti-sigma B factor antagonist
MEVSITKFKRCDMIKVTGRINSQTAPQLAEALKGMLDAEQYRIVFEMSDVDFISSAGLRVLIEAQKTCKRWNRGEIALACVPQQIRETLDLAGFVPLFRLFDSTVEAVGSF